MSKYTVVYIVPISQLLGRFYIRLLKSMRKYAQNVHNFSFELHIYYLPAIKLSNQTYTM